MGFSGLGASILANLAAMQNPVPDAPPERSTRQDADSTQAPGPDRPVAGVAQLPVAVVEIDGPSGPEPTRYGDWEKNGILSDF